MPADLPTSEIVVSLSPDVPLERITTKVALENSMQVAERGHGHRAEKIPGMYKKLVDGGVIQVASGSRARITVLFDSKEWDKVTQPQQRPGQNTPENHVFRLFWVSLDGIRRGVSVNEGWTPTDREGRGFHDPNFSEAALRELQEQAIAWFRDFVLEVVSRRRQVQWVPSEEQ